MDTSEIKIAIIGLGYVGLPLAVEFGKKYDVVGYDLNKERIFELKNGLDRTKELLKKEINLIKNIKLTHSETDIKDCNVYIITVPTPVNKNNKPNLKPLINASEMAGKHLNRTNLVIYESTVFPGCTEEICVPILEKFSGLRYKKDFFCGYSPERINPGDKKHTLTSIIKIVSGSDDTTLNRVDQLYRSIIKVETFKASSISVAEAAKVIENTQRDVNIALMNELAIIFDKLSINTSEVLEAASTKWNFLNFKPGLVGGHCIGVDPYYLTYKASEIGYHPEIILAGRRINDNMGNFIAAKTISELTKCGINPIGAKITILGLTFKENCPDIRNTKVVTLINELNDYKCIINVSDNWAVKSEVKEELKIDLLDLNLIKGQDAIIIAVGHKEYLQFTEEDWLRMLKPGGVIVDVKSILERKQLDLNSFRYWSL